MNSSLLPLYSDPQVKIRIGLTGREYKLSKTLLCKQSPYFAATFEGKFGEGQEQSTVLKDADGAVSERGFELLIQWLYLGRVVLSVSPPDEEVSATLDFVRFADMCGVTGMESQMAEHIKAIIVANPAPENPGCQKYRDPDTNTFCLTSQHLISAMLLPEGHPVRCILAAAAVEGFLRRGNDFKFWKEIHEVPNFAADLLTAVRASVKASSYAPTFSDPISEENLVSICIRVHYQCQ